MHIKTDIIDDLYRSLSEPVRAKVDRAVELLVTAKEAGKNVVVAVGSGPNLHEGVTTLIAELIDKGIIDGVTTSSAVISHEMAGTLDRVKRVPAGMLELGSHKHNLLGMFEVTEFTPGQLECLQSEMDIDLDLYHRVMGMEGHKVIKAAGNMAYPVGLRTELLAQELLHNPRAKGMIFEELIGIGADPMTMVGAGAKKGKPVLVTVPQLVGGGKTGLAIADSVPVSVRSKRIARLLDSADVIIESAIALTQEIHDGPLETYTGHGIWADWQGEWTYSLRSKKIIRIDLDPNLERIWHMEHHSGDVSRSVIQGLPKTKVVGIPFRMEMSGFARLPDSLPIVGDIGEIWPILATKVAARLGVHLDFMSYKQSTPYGEAMRQWIVENVSFVDRGKILEYLSTTGE